MEVYKRRKVVGGGAHSIGCLGARPLQTGVWSRGMIAASGAAGPGFKSRRAPIFLSLETRSVIGRQALVKSRVHLILTNSPCCSHTTCWRQSDLVLAGEEIVALRTAVLCDLV